MLDYRGDVTDLRVVRRVEQHPQAWRVWQPALFAEYQIGDTIRFEFGPVKFYADSRIIRRNRPVVFDLQRTLRVLVNWKAMVFHFLPSQQLESYQGTTVPSF